MAPDQLPTGEERERLLQSCKALIFQWSSAHLRGYLDQLDQQLFRMADKAGSGAEQGRFLAARALLESRRRLLERALFDHLKRAFASYLKGRDTVQEAPRHEGELRLVENDQLERSIAVAAMVRRAASNCSEALYALNQRLSALAGGRKVVDLGNPVAPAVFAEGLLAATRELPLDTASALVLYKLFDTDVLARIDKLYHLLNHELKSRGVLPHLRYRIEQQGTATLPPELQPTDAGASAARQQALMALVQRLQGGSDAPLSVRPLLLQLTPLQREGARQLAETLQQPAAAPRPHLSIPESGAVGVELIELVGLLFQQMLDDEQLPDAVKSLLSYLHTPYLKVALLDRQFFEQPDHPARALLNTLIAAGEQWVEPGATPRSELFNQLRLVVQRVLDEFDDDIRLFAQLQFELGEYLQQHTRRIRLAEQRARQAAQGEDRLREARGQVEAWLRRRLGGIALEEPVSTLLFEPWASFLAFNLLRFGDDSEPWHRATAVVDELLAQLAAPPAADALAQARLEQRWGLLAEALHQGLHTVGYDPDRGLRLIGALRQARGSIPATAPPATAPAEGADADPAEALDPIEFGSWFLFGADQPAAQQRTLKLAWGNPRTGHYMFVNRLGQQASLLRVAELAEGLRSGSLRPLPGPPDRPFIERALERIAEQLRRRPETTT